MLELFIGLFCIGFILFLPVWLYALIRSSSWWAALLDASYGRLVRASIAAIDACFDRLEAKYKGGKEHP